MQARGGREPDLASILIAGHACRKATPCRAGAVATPRGLWAASEAAVPGLATAAAGWRFPDRPPATGLSSPPLPVRSCLPALQCSWALPGAGAAPRDRIWGRSGGWGHSVHRGCSAAPLASSREHQEHPLTVTLKNVPGGCQMSPGGRVTPSREHGHTKWWKQADIPESEGGSCTDRRGACSHSRTF